MPLLSNLARVQICPKLEARIRGGDALLLPVARVTFPHGDDTSPAVMTTTGDPRESLLPILSSIL